MRRSPSKHKKFATLASGVASWAIGSIHGQCERLAEMHRQLADKYRTGENLVYLGNLLGRGTAVGETVDEVLKFRRTLLARPGARVEDFVYLRGSQEEMWQKLLTIQFAPNPGEVLSWMVRNGVDATISAYGSSLEEGVMATREKVRGLTNWTNTLRANLRLRDGHNALLSTLRQAAFTEDETLLFVHAGLDTSRPLSEQNDAFWWGGGDFTRIAAPFGRFTRVVRGFDPKHNGVQVDAFTATVDGGCGFDGPLVAMCFSADGKPIDQIEV